jgi:N4-gp56 family major capsid protein
MANTNTTTLNDLIANVVQEALFVSSERSIMRGLVKNYNVPKNTGLTLQVPIYPAQTAQDLVEATDMDTGASDVAVSSNVATITLAEVGIMTTVSDLALNHSVSNVIADLGKLFGEAVAKKIDQKLTALFSGFSTYGFGSATDTQTDLTAAGLFKAAATLKSAAVPGPYFGVFHPKAIYNVKKTLTNTFVNPNASAVVNQAMSEGFVGRIAGIDIYESSNVAEDSATSVVNGVFSRDALGLAIGQDIKISTQRDESKRATEVVCTAVLGVKELHDTYGCQVVGTNTMAA